MHACANCDGYTNACMNISSYMCPSLQQKISELEEQLLQKSKENDDLLMKNKIIEEQNANQIQEMADCAGEINDKQQKIDTMNKEMVDPKVMDKQ